MTEKYWKPGTEKPSEVNKLIVKEEPPPNTQSKLSKSILSMKVSYRIILKTYLSDLFF